jgi:uridylate kinase
MRENDIPIIVFSIRRPGALLDVLTGQGVHTVITEEPQGLDRPPVVRA